MLPAHASAGSGEASAAHAVMLVSSAAPVYAEGDGRHETMGEPIVKPYSDAELERLCRDLESDLVERKEAFKGDAPEKVREAVCAFANDLPGHQLPGVVLIGVRNDGALEGTPITDELLCSLADIKTDGNITPPPTLTVHKRNMGGAEIAVITVWPSDSPPVRCRGRIWVRVGPRRALASAQDERVVNEKRRHRDRPFDVHPVPGCTLDAMDLRAFDEEYLPALVARDVLEANERTAEQKLAAAKMIDSADSARPTVLGMLVLGKVPRDWLPGAYVQFLRVEGGELSDPILDEALIEGPIVQIVRRLDEKLEAHNRTRVSFVHAATEQRKSLYPLAALRQLTRNAILHRTYEHTHSPVRVTWYDDRIEIVSPGGPFGEVTEQSFGAPGITDYRNPNLAEAMRALGLVQKFGSGLPIAKRALLDNGSPPLELKPTAGHVLVVVRAAP